MAHNNIRIAASKNNVPPPRLIKVVKFSTQYCYISFERGQVPPIAPVVPPPMNSVGPTKLTLSDMLSVGIIVAGTPAVICSVDITMLM